MCGDKTGCKAPWISSCWMRVFLSYVGFVCPYKLGKQNSNIRLKIEGTGNEREGWTSNRWDWLCGIKAGASGLESVNWRWVCGFGLV